MSSSLVQLGKRSAAGSGQTTVLPAGAPALFIETYGCQMNVADSDLIRGQLADQGFRAADSADDADVILINTCAVRERAEERVFRRASELRAHKRRRPGTVLAVVGCMAEHLKERLSERAPYVDVVAGPDSYRRIAELVATARETERDSQGDMAPLYDVRLDKTETYDGAARARGDGVSAFVTIQRGCDKFCTFCVVPFTRGRERGVPPREVLRLCRELAASGHKEVTLLGQTVNSYRYEDVSFAELLSAVAGIDGIERIRFTSPYPVDFTDDVIEAMATLESVPAYMHLPVQSGSNAVLERMRRGYSVEQFVELVERIRSRIPDMAFSTDILTGFCGETEDDHQQTLALMKRVEFDSAFMFAYSERDLAYAAKQLEDDVSPDVKKRRLREIIALQESISIAKFEARVGHVEDVLLTGPSKRDPQELVGRTEHFKSVIVPGDGLESGQRVQVRIERSTMATLFGTPLNG